MSDGQGSRRQPRYTLNDFKRELEKLREKGILRDVLKMIPRDVDVDADLRCVAGIIDSLTPQERENPDLIDASRQRRVAEGSASDPADVKQLIQEFWKLTRILKR